MATNTQRTETGRGMRRTANAILAGGLVLAGLNTAWWQATLRSPEILPSSPLPAFDVRSWWIAGGAVVLGTLLRLVAGMRRKRAQRPAAETRSDTAAAAAAAGPPPPSLTPAPATTLDSVLQEAADLGLKVHTTRAGYVLREPDGRELVYADPRLLASAVRRQVAG